MLQASSGLETDLSLRFARRSTWKSHYGCFAMWTFEGALEAVSLPSNLFCGGWTTSVSLPPTQLLTREVEWRGDPWTLLKACERETELFRSQKEPPRTTLYPACTLCTGDMFIYTINSQLQTRMICLSGFLLLLHLL